MHTHSPCGVIQHLRVSQQQPHFARWFIRFSLHHPGSAGSARAVESPCYAPACVAGCPARGRGGAGGRYDNPSTSPGWVVGTSSPTIRARNVPSED